MLLFSLLYQEEYLNNIIIIFLNCLGYCYIEFIYDMFLALLKLVLHYIYYSRLHTQ